MFAVVGEAARVEIRQGMAPPLTTGTFGALDLCQTPLGEIEDKVSVVSLPGLESRMPNVSGVLKATAKTFDKCAWVHCT